MVHCECQGWAPERDPYVLLPEHAKEKVTGQVWQFSRNGAGVCLDFNTYAPSLAARWSPRFGTNLGHSTWWIGAPTLQVIRKLPIIN